MKLSTTDDQFHLLHVVVNKARENTKTVSVSKEALINLLIDHGKMVHSLQSTGELSNEDQP